MKVSLLHQPSDLYEEIWQIRPSINQKLSGKVFSPWTSNLGPYGSPSIGLSYGSLFLNIKSALGWQTADSVCTPHSADVRISDKRHTIGAGGRRVNGDLLLHLPLSTMALPLYRFITIPIWYTKHVLF